MKVKTFWSGNFNGIKQFVLNYPIATFYLLAFVISWAGFLPVLLRAHSIHFFKNIFWMAFLILPATGPALAAWITTSLEKDSNNGLAVLWANLMKPVSWRWCALVVLLPGAMQIVSYWLSIWLFPDQKTILPALPFTGVMYAAAMSFGSNPWEEVGWRGFALTRLQVKYNPYTAALIVGVLWALWHIPLFLWPGYPMAKMLFWIWAAGLIGQSFLYAWVFNSTARSLTAVVLLHLSFNIFGAIIGDRSNLTLSAVEITVATIILVIYGVRLNHRTDKT